MTVAEKADESPMPGASPGDLLIGQLMERIIDAHAEIRVALTRLGAQINAHEQSDALSFAAVNAGLTATSGQLAALRLSIDAATNAAVIQKEQVNAGWKVIRVIGALALGAISIFAIFFNHKY